MEYYAAIKGNKLLTHVTRDKSKKYYTERKQPCTKKYALKWFHLHEVLK